MKFFRVLSALAICAVLFGCTVFSLINAASSSAHYSRTSDIAYGELPRQRLDIYQPKAERADAPLVVFFYGGSWNHGSKKNYQFVAASLTRAGFVVILPDYRVYPEVTFPDFVSDGALAVAWAATHAQQYDANQKRIYLMGHSAGAQIAALLALDRRYLDAVEMSTADIAGFIGLSGPYDFLPLKTRKLQAVFPVDSRDQSQPIDFVGVQAPPTLLIHGADDTVVSVANSEKLAEKLNANSVPVTLKIYEDLRHASIVVSLAPSLNFIASTIDDVVEFIEAEKHRHDSVRIATPASGASLRDSFLLKGAARGPWYFEGEVPFQIVTDTDAVLVDGYVSAKSEWMILGFVPFEKTIRLPTVSKATPANLVIRKNNPTGLSRHDDSVRIPIFLEP